MTTVAVASLKGAPGVTTWCCLLAATWPRRAVVVEVDPWGGDLAARFGLAARSGWPSWAASFRRAGGEADPGQHLQHLPGGLEVLVGSRGADVPGPTSPEGRALLDWSAGTEPGGDLVLDVGRLPEAADVAGGWFERADVPVVVVRADAASALQLSDRAATLRARTAGRVRVAVLRSGPHRPEEVADLGGLPLLAVVPWDPVAAELAGGGPGGSRRLARSALVRGAARAAGELAAHRGAPAPAPTTEAPGAGTSPGRPDPAGRRPVRSGAAGPDGTVR